MQQLTVPVTDDMMANLRSRKVEGQTIEALASLYLRIGLMIAIDTPEDHIIKPLAPELP